MDDKQFILLIILIFPMVLIRDKKGKPIFYICGLTYHIIDHIADAIRAIFGE